MTTIITTHNEIFKTDENTVFQKIIEKTPEKKIKFKSKRVIEQNTFERSMERFIREIYDGDIRTNVTDIIPPYEFDIFLPNLGLFIELNGMYFHQQRFKNKSYHKIKQRAAREKGFSIIFIWSDQWNDPIKREAVKSLLRNRLGKTEKRIPARKTLFVELLDHERVSEFYEKNSLCAFTCRLEGKSIKNYGLLYKGRAVMVMTIRESTHKKLNTKSLEILAFASESNTIVQGGFTKSLKNIMKIKDKDYYTSINTSSMNDYSSGKIFKQKGFKKIKKKSIDSGFPFYARMSKYLRVYNKSDVDKQSVRLYEFQSSGLKEWQLKLN